MDGQTVPGLVVYICKGCQEGYHSHCTWGCYGPAAEVSDHGLSDVLWTDPALVTCCSIWCSGVVLRAIAGEFACWWSLCSHLAPLSAQQGLPCTLFSLTSTLADTTSLEACFVHSHVPLVADPHGNIKDEGLVVDLAVPPACRNSNFLYHRPQW